MDQSRHDRRVACRALQRAFVFRKDNLIPTYGTQRTGQDALILASAHKASMAGHTAWYTSSIDLLEDLSRARRQGRLKRSLTWLLKPHIILVDGVGYEEHTI